MRAHDDLSRRRLRATKRCPARSRFDSLEGRLLLATFTVTTTSDAGAGSLREAVVQANASADGGGGAADRIGFDIPGSGTQTIAPLSALPASTGRVVIDGTSQPGYSGTPL